MRPKSASGCVSVRVCAAAVVAGLLAMACGSGTSTGAGASSTPADSTAEPEGNTVGDADGEGVVGSGETSEFETVPTAPEPLAEIAEGETPEEPGTTNGGESGTPSNFHDDPRGGVFADFQRGFDRNHPFTSLDSFCLPHDPPEEELRATGPGIQSETITLVHMRSQLEELISSGFAVDVGDPAVMFDTFTHIVNDRCGGVWGRQIDLRLVEVLAIGAGGVDIDTLRNAACIEATEDHEGVIVMNATTFAGTAQLCITEEHDSVLIGHEALPEEYLRRGGGRLLTTATTLEEILRALVRYAVDSGALEGRRVGVVAPNTPGEAEAVEGSLVSALRSAGVDVRVFDVLDCAGTAICVGGIAESVQRLLEEEVDVLFPTLNAISLPAYITEMMAQGFEPGDIRFFNSDFNNQGNEVVNDLILAFGGTAAGELYDGTVLLVTTDQGRFRDPDWKPSAFNEMCMREYRENSPSGENFDPRDPVDTNKYGILGLICSVYRVALRALYDAGPNPSRADIAAALENLGPVDLSFMLPASLVPGKWSMGDALHPVTFRYPCPVDVLASRNNSCLMPSDYSELLVKAG